jgi:signal transduction histidine kinase/ActR/RegA family two-component response regulator
MERVPDGDESPANVVHAWGHGDIAPFEFLDGGGRPTGFAVELLEAVAVEAGLHVQIHLGEWKEVLAAFEAGRIDLVVGMHITPERLARYLFSKPYTDLPYDVFVHDDPSGIRSLDDLRGLEVLVQGRAMGEKLARDAGAIPVPLSSPRDVVKALSEGRCRYAIVGRYPALWMAAQMHLEHVVPVGLDIPSHGYAFVAMPGREELIAALDRGLASIKSSGRYQDIWERWLGPLQNPRADLWTYLRFTAWILGPLFALLLLWALWTRSLRREVALRTRQLETELDMRRRMEEELSHAEKLESLGVLAGGIAHDFNNVLAAIAGNLSVARSSGDPSMVTTYVSRAEEAARRAGTLTRQLLTFARGGAPVKRVESLGPLVREAAAFILSGSTSRAAVSIAKDLWPAEVDAGQLIQVIHNLTLNAAQAMPEGGTVEIEASNRLIEVAGPTGLGAGPHVHLSVKDHGVGIPRDRLARIFEPFYTTKPGGTGLGLSICYSIVRRHGGWIGVESGPGDGTTFTVVLPAFPEGRVEVGREAAPRSNGAGRRVLVMDDDDLVRATMEAQVRTLGFETIAVADGAAALAAFETARREGRPFAAVVLDLTVPGAMGGTETLARLRELDADVRAVLATGYSGDPMMSELDRSGFAAVVGKPFTLDELAAALDKALL